LGFCGTSDVMIILEKLALCDRELESDDKMVASVIRFLVSILSNSSSTITSVHLRAAKSLRKMVRCGPLGNPKCIRVFVGLNMATTIARQLRLSRIITSYGVSDLQELDISDNIVVELLKMMLAVITVNGENYDDISHFFNDFCSHDGVAVLTGLTTSANQHIMNYSYELLRELAGHNDTSARAIAESDALNEFFFGCKQRAFSRGIRPCDIQHWHNRGCSINFKQTRFVSTKTRS